MIFEAGYRLLLTSITDKNVKGPSGKVCTSINHFRMKSSPVIKMFIDSSNTYMPSQVRDDGVANPCGSPDPRCMVTILNVTRGKPRPCHFKF